MGQFTDMQVANLLFITVAMSLAVGGAAVMPPTRIAIGSCNNALLPQPFWRSIVAYDPQVFIWLGT